MRTNATMPAEIRLALLRDAVAVLDPRRHPGTRAEAAAVLCETLVAEGTRVKNPQLVAEAVLVVAATITEGPIPAGARTALLDALRDAVGLLAGAHAPAAAQRAGQRRGFAQR